MVRVGQDMLGHVRQYMLGPVRLYILEAVEQYILGHARQHILLGGWGAADKCTLSPSGRYMLGVI